MTDTGTVYVISNAEIFETGEHNGDRYTEDDLDDMVDAYHRQGFIPAVKIGHAEEPGQPAYGYVENVRRVGTKLLADLTHIPMELYEVIKRRGYDRLSAEIFWNLKSGGKKFRRALKAVALLGAEVPAVTTLAPLHTLFANAQGEVKIYDFPSEGGIIDMAATKRRAQQARLEMMSLDEARQTAGEILDSRTRMLLMKNEGMTYSQAFAKVKAEKENEFLVELYSGIASPERERAGGGITPEQAGEALAAHALRIAREECVPLHEANQRAYTRFPALARMYEQISTPARFRE